MPSIIFRQVRTIRVRTGYHRASSTSATDAALKILEATAGKTTIRKQILDSNQIQRLSLTLLRSNLYPNHSVKESAPKNGTPIPPGYHLVYFTPSALENELGEDGTDRTFNPMGPFTRRMWAGGSMNWAKGMCLKVGDEVEERTRILSAVPKKSRDGSEMVLVGVEKELWNGNGRVVIDQRYALPEDPNPSLSDRSLLTSCDFRSWIFMPRSESTGTNETPLDKSMNNEYIFSRSAVQDIQVEASESRQKSLPPQHLLPRSETFKRSFTWSPIALFRFSALTFNAHMIHYCDPWCRTVENLHKPVVHGPLNLINILDLWRDNYAYDQGDAPRKITYRALAPLYSGEPYTIVINREAGKVIVEVTNEMKTNMTAEILM
jgi:hydroxyacyl-ACP dehydratase HTD2-like protein with hotdog domain